MNTIIDVKLENKYKMHSAMETVNKASGLIVLLFIGFTLIYALAIHKWALFSELLLDFSILAVSVILCINIHECGHFVFGKLSGFRLSSYTIGFFKLSNESGSIKFSVGKNKGFAGLCSMLPPGRLLSDYQYCLYYAGGIIFNFLSALIMAVVYTLLSELPASINMLFIDFILCSLVLGLLNFLPFVLGNNPSDGQFLSSILLKKPLAEKLKCIHEISAQLDSGCRPRDIQINYPQDLDRPGALDMTLLLCRYYRFLDSGNKPGVISLSELLEKKLHFFPSQSLPNIYAELCFAGCFAGDEEKAKYYYGLANRSLKNNNSVTVLRIKAYYEYFINQDFHAAMDYCEQALGTAGQFPLKGQGLMEIELVERLKAELLSEKQHCRE